VYSREEAHAIYGALSQWGIDPVIQAYLNPSWLDCQLKFTAKTYKRLLPVGLCQPTWSAGPTATQNSPFLPQRWRKPSPVLTAPTHRGMHNMEKHWDGRPANGRHQSQYW